MRIVFISSFFLLFSAMNASGDIVYCFSAPGDNVIGLGSSISRVWAIDDGTLQIYELDYNGSILNQFPVMGTATPTGLAWGDSVLYYADGGTAILHTMSDDGSYLGSYDFSDSGISSIRGLGYNNNIDPYLPEALLITDDIADAAFAAYPPLLFDQVELIADLSEAPDIFYDAAISLGYGSIWIACGDLYYNVQAFNLGGFSYDWHFYDINNVVGIADFLEMPTDEFLWLSDPDTDLISLVYYGMGVEEESGSFSYFRLEAVPNPFSSTVTVSVPGLTYGSPNLHIYDLTGRMVVELEPVLGGGDTAYSWNGRSTSGAELPDGIYSARLSSGDISSAVMLLKL